MTIAEKHFVRVLAQYIAEQKAQLTALINVLELNGVIDSDELDDEFDEISTKIVRNTTDRIPRELEVDPHVH